MTELLTIAGYIILTIAALIAVARTSRRHGPFRHRCLCGATESSPAYVVRHEQHCDDCQRIIRRLKETS